MTHSQEEWKPVVGFEKNYAVSSHGRIKNIRRGKCLKPTVTSRGYAIVNLVDASRGLRKCSHVYNLVTRAFIGVKPDGVCVNHIDGDKTNNRLSNLEYMTYGENAAHAIATGLRKRKLSDEQVREIRKLKGKMGAIRTARKFGIGKSLVSTIRLGKSYADVE